MGGLQNHLIIPRTTRCNLHRHGRNQPHPAERQPGRPGISVEVPWLIAATAPTAHHTCVKALHRAPDASPRPGLRLAYTHHPHTTSTPTGFFAADEHIAGSGAWPNTTCRRESPFKPADYAKKRRVVTSPPRPRPLVFAPRLAVAEASRICNLLIRHNALYQWLSSPHGPSMPMCACHNPRKIYQ